MVQFTAPVLAQLLEAAPDATVCVTRDGRIQLVNAQAEQLFGYRRADLIGLLVEILVPEAAKARHVDLRTRYADDPRPRLIDARTNLSARRADGTTFPAEISLSAIHANEEILISAAVRDVTAQWQARDQLRRANEDLRWIIRSMAHDLRTPLRALAGFSATLTEEYADALGDTGRSYTGRIEAASEHMGHVLDALLNLASTARADIHPRQVDLAALAAGIADELQLADPARSVRFTIQRPLPALADPALIRTVLANLLGNAWKFTSGRDDATIEFGAMPAERRRRLLLRPRQWRRLRRRLRRQALQAVRAAARGERLPRHRHRPRQRAPDHRPPPGRRLGRGHPRSRRHHLLHSPHRRIRGSLELNGRMHQMARLLSDPPAELGLSVAWSYSVPLRVHTRHALSDMRS